MRDEFHIKTRWWRRARMRMSRDQVRQDMENMGPAPEQTLHFSLNSQRPRRGQPHLLLCQRDLDSINFVVFGPSWVNRLKARAVILIALTLRISCLKLTAQQSPGKGLHSHIGTHLATFWWFMVMKYTPDRCSQSKLTFTGTCRNVGRHQSLSFPDLCKLEFFGWAPRSEQTPQSNTYCVVT